MAIMSKIETTSVTEAYQHDKPRKARRAQQVLDFGHSPQDPLQPGKSYPQGTNDP